MERTFTTRPFSTAITRRLGFLHLGTALVCASLAACVESADPEADTAGSAGTSAGTSAGGRGPMAGSGGTSGEPGFACTMTADASATVEVEGGEFVMGCNEEVDDACDDDEKPQHVVTLADFEIDRTEVTQAQYSACVLDGACAAPACEWNCENTDYPAVCVDWIAAQAYCAWAGKRLPSEAEWEKAARGTEGAKFPWGNDEPDCTLANFADCGGAVQAVGELPDGASPYGALDMSGNVVEMVADYYDAGYYGSSPDTDPTGPASGERYGGRGGGYRSDADWQRSSKRDWYDPSDTSASLGFRCAR